MNTMRIASWGGASAILAGLWWLAITPFMATVGFCEGVCDSWYDKPLVIRFVGRWLADQGWFSGAAGDDLYFGYGRLFVLVYLFMIAGLVAFQLVQKSRLGTSRHRPRWSYRFLLTALSLAALGDFFSYGVGVVSEAAWRYGFALEMLSLLGVAAGTIWYAVITRRAGAMPPWVAMALLLSGIGIVAMLFDRGLIMYLPNAPTLPLVVAWFALGVHLITSSYRTGTADGARAPS